MQLELGSPSAERCNITTVGLKQQLRNRPDQVIRYYPIIGACNPKRTRIIAH